MQDKKRPVGLYIHIPFCVEKCRYCDFLSFGGTDRDTQKRYLAALLKEMDLWEISGRKALPEDTVFLGGGTPSLLGPALLEPVLERLPKASETTMEANPGTLNLQDLRAYRALGIRRLSLGVQAFHDGLLCYLGRIHSAATAVETFQLARKAGFDNINLDLIFAIPGQTMKMWQDTVETALSLEPEHLSFYSLQIEEGTPFFQMLRSGELQPLSDELDREMYHWAAERLGRAGYHHYEISNAAKPGYESRHNLKYWSMEDYLGLGLGAHSFIEGRRFSNETDLRRYIEIAEAQCASPACGPDAIPALSKAPEGAAPDLPSPFVVWSHTNTRQDHLAEFLFTGLRKTGGVSLSEFASRFGAPIDALYPQALQKHLSGGLLIKDEAAHRLRLTPNGIDLSNYVLSDFV